MARYVDIECDAVTEVIGRKAFRNRSDIQDFLDNIPTADVVEVKHGYWIENDYRSFDGFETVVYPNEALKCSECNHNFKKELLWRKNYCPECGAKMDGERKCDNE